MAFVTDYCRRWQCHKTPVIRLNTWSGHRLSRVPKLVIFSYSHEKQQRRGLFGRSDNSGVRTISTIARLESITSPRIQSKLNGQCPSSKFIPINEVSDEGQVDDSRPAFDLDLAVLLAGFAFESYNTPAKDAGILEMDAGDSETFYLSREFIKSTYDGQFLVTIKKGVHFPGLDLWGTSDPYVVFRIEDCCVRTRTIWANKDPVWNENLALNIKTSEGQNLLVAAWDANMVTAKRRMGNASVSLDNLCDGKPHRLELNLEGMGGGATLFLEVQYKSFAQIEAEKNQFSFGSLFSGELLANAYKSVFGENGISVVDFMVDFTSIVSSGSDLSEAANEKALDTTSEDEDKPSAKAGNRQPSEVSKDPKVDEGTFPKSNVVRKEASDSLPKDDSSVEEATGKEDEDGEVEIWKTLADSFSRTLKPFGIDMSGVLQDKETWEVGEDVKTVGLESQKKAELLYAERGLAVVEGAMEESNEMSGPTEANGGVSGNDSDPFTAVGKDVLAGLVKQTEGIVGAWAIFNKSSGENQSSVAGQDEQSAAELESKIDLTTTTTSMEDVETAYGNLGKEQAKDTDTEADKKRTTMFSTAESAMEAWALLATTVGGASLVKSDFEKICFVENDETDTQVAIWRDSRRQRLVVAFRGTEQTKWKDLMTDISMLTTGFKPNLGAGGEPQKDGSLVHGGFLRAYDSVRSRILSLVQSSINSSSEPLLHKCWHVYVTGHSLGGALATLFALDLSSSKLAKNGDLKVTMYNYGSPRVGDTLFANNYNKVVKDSWRVVNHRDIVPTVPRLMGYCHVAQPIYLTTEESAMSDLLDDGYCGDVLGEATPDIIINKFMKGEQTLLQKLFDTEIAMLRAMRDGSAVMQHMEDFYYITLLQRVESRIRRLNKKD